MEIGSVYNFNTKAAASLGASRTNMRYLGSLAFAQAVKMTGGENLYVKFQQLRATVGATGLEPENDIYDLFESTSNGTEIFARSWVDQASVTLVSNTGIRIILPTANLSDINNLAATMKSLGYSDAKVESM